MAEREGATARPWWFLDGDPQGEGGEDPLETARGLLAHGARTSAEHEVGASRLAACTFVRSRLTIRCMERSPVAVETEVGWIGYTGDLQFHGAGGARTQAFADGSPA